MSIRVMTRIWDHSVQKGSDLLVLLALADIANDAGFCWPSVDTVSQRARLTRRATQKILRALEQEGELAVMRGEGPKGTHLYQITTPVSVPSEPVRTGGEKFSPRPIEQGGGEPQDPKGANPSSPKPLVDPSVEPSVVLTPVSPPMTEDDEFEAWWGGYPNKQKKPRARKAWEVARKKNLPALPQVLQALAQHKRSDQWTRDGGRYVPHPATWLNEEMWADRLPESGDSAGNVRWQPDFAGIDVEAEMRRMLGNPL